MVHVRVWSDNPNHIDTFCGLHQTRREKRKFNWQNNLKGATCQRCIQIYSSETPTPDPPRKSQLPVKVKLKINKEKKHANL